MKICFRLLCLLAVASVVHGADEPVVGKAVAEIKLGKAQYFLGEPFDVTFVLRNTDDKAISYGSWWDDRRKDRERPFPLFQGIYKADYGRKIKFEELGVDTFLPAPLPELIVALDALHDRGQVKPRFGNGTHHAATYLKFHRLAKTPPPRPEGWLDGVKPLHAPYPIQLAILEAIPDSMPPECRDLVLSLLLNAKDVGVLRKACDIAGKSGDKTFLPELLVIARVKDAQWLFEGACEAAKRLGARYELAVAASDRLTASNKILRHKALMCLMDLTLESNSYNHIETQQEIVALQDEWRKWIAEHREDIEAGKKFKTGNAPGEAPPTLRGGKPGK